MVNWKKIGAAAVGILLVGAGTFGCIDLKNGQDANADTLANIESQLAEANAEPVVVAEPIVEPSQLDDVQADVEAIKADMFAEDALEASAEVLALEEIEDDDYEVLYDFMVKPIIDGGLGLDIYEEDDIKDVIVRDVDSEVLDLEDGDVDVTHELKVYYEDADGNDGKVYLDVDSTIEDGEVEDQIVSEN